MTKNLSMLPRMPADRFTGPFMRFLRIEAVAGAVLLVSTVMALALANSRWSDAYLAFWELHAGFHWGDLVLSRSLKHWINDALMTLFFFVIALELKRELVLGELRDRRMAALPFAAALGGMLVPPAIFLAIVGNGPGAQGWGTVMSTDTAFVIGCLAILGSRLPQSLRLFLLALAIFDDVGAIMVVAIGYGGTLHGLALGLALAGFAGVVAMGWMGVRSVLAFFIVGGAIWLALDEAGIHPTLAGVALGLMTPAHSWVSDRRLHAILDRVVAYPPGEHWAGDGTARDDLHQARIATREALSPIERLEILLHPWVAFGILPLFALANAAIPFASATFDPTLTAAIIAAFVVGKPAGILLFSFLAEKLRIGVRSPDLSWGLLAGGGMLTGIGFTMALFIADLAFRREVIPSVKLGVLGASALSALAGMIVLFLARPSAGTARN
ncbi:MAG: Na+/H+ antiporter NhaA [Methylobacterium sp.]|jgi:NhaA family Na+:H+ antiporter|nr:Na+/H+ antiporter NhaA [Methylobacterium sp.]